MKIPIKVYTKINSYGAVLGGTLAVKSVAWLENSGGNLYLVEVIK